jgi:eukaryotic translation initiation factor 2C
MPPRVSPAASRGGRGGRGGPARGGGPGGHSGGVPGELPGSHVTTVGVKRPDFGSSGKPLGIFVNSFVTTIPESIIHHYDGTFLLLLSSGVHLIIEFDPICSR